MMLYLLRRFLICTLIQVTNLVEHSHPLKRLTIPLILPFEGDDPFADVISCYCQGYYSPDSISIQPGLFGINIVRDSSNLLSCPVI